MTLVDDVVSSSGESVADASLTSVGKALAILDAFEGAESLLGVSEVARRTHLHKSTAFRLLSSLERTGYVERRGDRYCLGRRLFELGNQVSWCRPRSLRDTALPLMCDLFGLVRRTMHLAVLEGADVLYVEKLQGREQPIAPTRVGGRVSARTTALGKAMLAFSGSDVIDRALTGLPAFRTPYTIVLPDLFCAELADVRRRGVAFDREEVRIGLTCIAAPILVRGVPVAAISVTGGTTDFDPMSMADKVRATANAIAAGLC